MYHTRLLSFRISPSIERESQRKRERTVPFEEYSRALKMVRAPCCEKMGLKKGPWTPEEDQILVSYIQQHGHGNWRALPKQAGLLRCGKSCRLRWTNYLRPDIKRGNFSKEEEETIIELHEMLGNRWSAIAARLPGRTDNEIKNVWHTHLKKKLKNYQTSKDSKRFSIKLPKSDLNIIITPRQSESMNSNFHAQDQRGTESPSEPSSITDSSAATTRVTSDQMVIKNEEMDSSEYFPEIDESFWSEDLSAAENSNLKSNFSGVADESKFQQLPLSPVFNNSGIENGYLYSSGTDECSMDFWYNFFVRAGDLPELPEF